MEKATVGAEAQADEVRVVPDNDEATEAWSGVLFDRFVEFRDLIITGKVEPNSPQSGVADISVVE